MTPFLLLTETLLGRRPGEGRPVVVVDEGIGP